MKTIVGRAKRAPHRAVQSRFCVIYICRYVGLSRVSVQKKVIKAVRIEDSGVSGIFQKSEFVSKYLALPTWPNISSTVCIRCLSRQTLPFNLVRSTQIHTLLC